MKVRTTIRIDSETLKKAHQLGLNVSKCCENALNVYIHALTNANSEMAFPSGLNPGVRQKGPTKQQSSGSIVRSSIPAFRAGDPGSNPGRSIQILSSFLAYFG